MWGAEGSWLGGYGAVVRCGEAGMWCKVCGKVKCREAGRFVGRRGRSGEVRVAG